MRVGLRHRARTSFQCRGSRIPGSRPAPREHEEAGSRCGLRGRSAHSQRLICPRPETQGRGGRKGAPPLRLRASGEQNSVPKQEFACLACRPATRGRLFLIVDRPANPLARTRARTPRTSDPKLIVELITPRLRGSAVNLAPVPRAPAQSSSSSYPTRLSSRALTWWSMHQCLSASSRPWVIHTSFGATSRMVRVSSSQSL